MALTSTSQEKPSSITEIERLGFTCTEDPQFDLTRLGADPKARAQRRVQVRERGHYAPKESVERYAIQMAHSKFPPIVVTADDHIVDGNTRIEAALSRDNKFFPAIVLGVSYSDGSEQQRSELLILAATLNSLNGVPLTAKEARVAVESFLARGIRAEQIARALGVKPSTVSQVRREIDAVAKLKRVGVNPNGSYNRTALRALGHKDALALNDIPFKTLATLAHDADLKMTEIISAAKDVREAGSDTGQVERLETKRIEMGDRIRERELTGSATPPAPARLRQVLGNVVKFAGREQELIETDPKVHDAHVAALSQAVAVLNKVLEAQGPALP